MRTGNSDGGWMSKRWWQRWVAVIAVAMSMIAAAPALAAGRGTGSTADPAHSLGDLLGRLAMFGFVAWIIKSLVSRRKGDQQYTTTIEPAGPPYTGPQLVGLACVHCQQKNFI